MKIFFDIFNNFKHLIIDDCISRIAEHDCPEINDRVTCLTSKENRDIEWKGVQVKGSDCV